jgi:polar amino acid transport system substrate-binding protein
MKKTGVWLVGLMTAGILAAGAAAGAEELIFVTTGMSPPYAYQEGGEIVGMDVDVVNLFCEKKGITPTYRPVPWKRALTEAQQGRAHGVMSLFRTEERENFLYYPKTPVNSVRTVVVGRKADDRTINELEDLKELRIGVLHAWQYGPEFDNMTGLNKVLCRDKEELLKLLDRERVDVIIDSEDVFNFNVKKYGLSSAKFEVLHQIRENPIFVAFSKAGLGDRGKKLAAEFNKFFQGLKAAGKLPEIRAPYR